MLLAISMKEPLMNTQEQFATLERRIRRQRLGLIGLALAFGATLIGGVGVIVEQDLTVESLTIMQDGKPRIVFGEDEKNGDFGAAFLDMAGKARITIGLNANSSEGGIAVLDKSESPRIVLGDGQQGAGILLFGAGISELPLTPAPKD